MAKNHISHSEIKELINATILIKNLDYDFKFDSEKLNDAQYFIKLANFLNVDPILLWNNQIDRTAFLDKLNGNHSLPSKYSEIRSSSMTSLVNVISIFEKYNLKEYALKRIQIDEKAINQHQNISILAINDLLNLGKNYFGQEDYDKLASRNATHFYQSTIQNIIRPNHSQSEKVTMLFEQVKHFERNWDYKIEKSTHNRTIISTRENEEMLHSSSYEKYTNFITNYCRFSFVKQLLKIIDINSSIEIENDWQNHNSEFEFSIQY